jgi:hypothetical protein
MPHTHSRYQQDLGYTDGILLFSAEDFLFSGTTAIARNTAGDWSLNQGAGQAVTYGLNLLSAELVRTGFGEDLQQQFGGAGIAASAEPQGRPPFTGVAAITPRTANKVKGIKFNSVTMIEQITGNALTTHNLRIDQTIFANGVANAITSVVANGANGLPTGTQATNQLTTVAFPAPAYIITPLTELWLELAVTTQGGGAYRLYGVQANIEFNYN